MRADDQDTRKFYTEPAAMTSAGRHAALLEDLPDDPAALAGVLHGLVIHEHMVGGYGVTLSEADRRTVHVRRAGDLLAEIAARDPRPRQLVDAQIDGVQLGWFPIDFDLTDVPRDQFLVAGEAWRRIRSGAADPAKFGLSQMKEAGDWWIAANLMRDGAALLNMELLPWDCWGAMPTPVDSIDDDLAVLFDRLAEVTLAPDDYLAELRLMYDDDRLRVPVTVRNAVRGCEEPLWPADQEAKTA